MARTIADLSSSVMKEVESRLESQGIRIPAEYREVYARAVDRLATMWVCEVISLKAARATAKRMSKAVLNSDDPMLNELL